MVIWIYSSKTETQTWLSTEVVKLCVLLEGIGVYLGMTGRKQDSASSNCISKYIRIQINCNTNDIHVEMIVTHYSFTKKNQYFQISDIGTLT